MFAHRRISGGWVVVASVVAGLVAGCASTVPKGKLADGSPVPAGATFTPPTPTSKMPNDVFGRIGSSGVRGVFRAELVVSETGVVSDVRVTSSVGEAADAELIPAFRRMTFTPALLNGKPVGAIYATTVNFTSK